MIRRQANYRYIGKWIVADREISNQLGRCPAGKPLRVVSTGVGFLTLEAPPCSTCGIAWRVRVKPPFNFRIVDPPADHLTGAG